MFNFTDFKITQAAQGGYLIRPITGDKLELHVGADDDLSKSIKPAVYDLGSVLVDIYQNQIVFIDPDGRTITLLDGPNGTNAIIKNIVVMPDPNPQQTKAQQILQDKREAAKKFDDDNSFV